MTLSPLPEPSPRPITHPRADLRYWRPAAIVAVTSRTSRHSGGCSATCSARPPCRTSSVLAWRPVPVPYPTIRNRKGSPVEQLAACLPNSLTLPRSRRLWCPGQGRVEVKKQRCRREAGGGGAVRGDPDGEAWGVGLDHHALPGDQADVTRGIGVPSEPAKNTRSPGSTGWRGSSAPTPTAAVRSAGWRYPRRPGGPSQAAVERGPGPVHQNQVGLASCSPGVHRIAVETSWFGTADVCALVRRSRGAGAVVLLTV